MNKDPLVLSGKKYPYCNGDTQYVDSAIVYGKSYGMIYLCAPCKAYVGVHKTDNVTALGRLANTELRAAKKLAHYYFDSLWKTGQMKRQSAYKWLSAALNVEPRYTHIGMFDVEECNRTAELSKLKANG